MLKYFFVLCVFFPSLTHSQMPGGGMPPGGANMQQCISEIQALGCGQPGPGNSSFRTCIESKRSQLSAQCQQMGSGPGGPGGQGGSRPPRGGSTANSGNRPPTAPTGNGEVEPPNATPSAESASTGTSGPDCTSIVDGDRTPGRRAAGAGSGQGVESGASGQ